MNDSTGLSLQILEGHTTTADLGSVLGGRDDDTDDDSLLKDSDLLLELGLNLLDNLAVTTEADLVSSFVAVLRARISISFDCMILTQNVQSDKASLLVTLGRTTSRSDEITKVLTALTNEVSMLNSCVNSTLTVSPHSTYVFLLNGQLDSNLVANFLDNVQDSLLGRSNSLLVTSDSDSSLLVLTSLPLNVNLSTSVVLDSVDGSTALTNNLSHSLAWDFESGLLPGLSLESSSLK